MTRKSLILGVACFAIVSLTVGGIARAAEPKKLRTGELAVQLARAAGVSLPAEDAEKVAAARLARFGIDLGSSLSRPVVERDLVLVGRALGLEVTSEQPGNPVTPGQGTAFVGVARGSLLAAEGVGSGNSGGNGNGNGGTKQGDINASCKGRNARSGRKGEPASPANPNATAPPCEEEPIPEPTP
jgi:hypothetical protein